MKLQRLFLSAILFALWEFSSVSMISPVMAGSHSYEQNIANQPIVAKPLFSKARVNNKSVAGQSFFSFDFFRKIFSKKVVVVPKVSKTSGLPYNDLVMELAKKHNVPVDLAHAVIKVESNHNPKAKGGAGEIGLMQLMPATARHMGFTGNLNALYDPETNLEYGMRYLAKAHSLSEGDTCTTILKYNAGHGAKHMNKISARYCTRVKIILSAAN